MPDTKRILVAEDEKALCDLYASLLEAEGYQVDKALDGKQTWDKMAAGGYDLVLLDILMPQLSGLEVLEQINKTTPTSPNKKVVLLTNISENQTIAEALKHGASGYMIKSRFNPEEFIKVVKTYL